MFDIEKPSGLDMLVSWSEHCEIINKITVKVIKFASTGFDYWVCFKHSMIADLLNCLSSSNQDMLTVLALTNWFGSRFQKFADRLEIKFSVGIWPLMWTSQMRSHWDGMR